MSAETLRRAAALMRERSQIGGPLDYPEPWAAKKLDLDRYGIASLVTCHEDGSGDLTDALDDAVAEYIAAVAPSFLLAVADWLDFEARSNDLAHQNYPEQGPWPVDDHALTVARTYLGENESFGPEGGKVS